MSRRKRSPFDPWRLARVVLTMLVLSGVAAGSIGFPVTPGGFAGGDFPCQGHGCGCRTASDCWLGCCCLTPAQRLAWATKRGITPPAGVVKLARTDTATAREQAVGPADQGKACCRKDLADRKPCCGSSARKDRRGSESDLPGFARSRCRGFGQSWVTIGQPLGLPEKPEAVAVAQTSEPVVVASTGYDFFLDSPPTRPG